MSQTQKAKPTKLTNQFIKLIHQANGIHQGYFQIIQFHQVQLLKTNSHLFKEYKTLDPYLKNCNHFKYEFIQEQLNSLLINQIFYQKQLSKLQKQQKSYQKSQKQPKQENYYCCPNTLSQVSTQSSSRNNVQTQSLLTPAKPIQKRQKYYSTHISDGFFKCKVIFRQKPSRQIDKGQIKLFSILYGNISNQGNRILMVFNELQVWDYPRTIGIIRNWRYESRNCYINGNNCIEWVQSEKVAEKRKFKCGQNQQEQEDQVLSYCASQINLKNNNNIIKPKKSQQQKSNQKQPLIVQPQPQVFSFTPQQANLNNCNKQTQQNIKDSYIESTQSITKQINKQPNHRSKSQLKITKNRNNNRVEQNINSKVKDKEINKNKKLLIVTQSQSQNNFSYSKDIKKYNTIEQSQNQLKYRQSDKNYQQQQQQPQYRKSNNNNNYTQQVFDDLDIFQQIQAQVLKLRQKKNKQIIDQATQDIFDQINKYVKNRNIKINKNNQDSINNTDINKKSNSSIKINSSININNKSNSNSNIKQKVSTFSYIFQQNQLGHQKYTNNNVHNNSIVTPQKISITQFKQLQYQSQQKISSYYILPNKISINQLHPVDDYKLTNPPNISKQKYKQKQKNWISIVVLCHKIIQQSNCTKLLVVAQEWIQEDIGVIFNIFLNGGQMYDPFTDGCIYEMSLINVNVVQPMYQQMYTRIELRANVQQLKARKIKYLPQHIPQIPHFCFIPLQKIHQVAQNKFINLTAVVYRYKNINRKNNGWINIFTLINPFTSICIDFTIFDAQKLTYQPGSPIIIFNGFVKIYQGKKQINVKNYTFYYFGEQNVFGRFSEWIWDVKQIKRWIDQGGNVSMIVGNNQDYKVISNLKQTDITSQFQQESMLAQTPIVRITKISPFYFRLLCDKCNKKLVKNTILCFTCGKRQNCYKQYQLSLQISDNSYSCYVEFNHYDTLQLIGQDGENFQQFGQNYLHKRVKMWLQLNPKYKALVTKMEVFKQDNLVKEEFQILRRMVRYI